MRIRHGFSFLLGAALSAVIAVGLAGGFALDVLATIIAGLICLAWLGVIVVLPWNLHFEARHLGREFEAAKARGITVTPAQEQEAARVARRMLQVSLALHAGSAIVVGIFAVLSSSPIAATFAALFLLSTLFRPGVESYRYLKEVLTRARAEVNYPRDDVLSLVEDVRRLVADSESTGDRLQRLEKAHADVRVVIDRNAAAHVRRSSSWPAPSRDPLSGSPTIKRFSPASRRSSAWCSGRHEASTVATVVGDDDAFDASPQQAQGKLTLDPARSWSDE